MTGIEYQLQNHVARVTIDRPDVRNALDHRAESRLEEIWQQIEADREVRVVVLTGAGDKAFCAGADMSAHADATATDYWLGANRNGFGGLTLRTSMTVPVIARVNGHAIGGGMELALGADIVVAADKASFALAEPRVGRMPLGGGIPQIVRRIPYVHAMGLLLTGRRIDAAEAARLSLVNEVVPAAELDSAVDRWVNNVLACAPTSIRAIKQIVAQTSHLAAQEALLVRLPELIRALQSDDAREGVAAFREKRQPLWTGH